VDQHSPRGTTQDAGCPAQGRPLVALMRDVDRRTDGGPSVELHELEAAPGAVVAVVVLTNPARRNALTLGMWRELEAVADGLAPRREVRAVVLRGAGSAAFAAGADISEFSRERHDVASASRYNAQLARTLRAVAGLQVPTVAALQGFAVGGGCELAHACDLRLAARDVRAGIPIGRLGVVLGVTEAKLLVRHVGVSGLKRLLYSGALWDADECLRTRLVDEVVDDLWASVADLVDVVVASRSTTMRAAGVVADLASGLDDAAADQVHELLVAAYGGAGLAEGVDAFLARRAPRFADVEGPGGERRRDPAGAGDEGEVR